MIVKLSPGKTEEMKRFLPFFISQIKIFYIPVNEKQQYI